jgi:gluconolactonase
VATVTHDQPLVALSDCVTFADGLDHPEGICTTPDGRIWVGGEAGQVYRIEDDDTARQLTTTEGFMLGLAADGEGRLYACDSVAAAVWRIDASSGEREVFTKGTDDLPMRVPNWLCFAPDASLYISDSGPWKGADGRIYVVRPGCRTELWTTASRDFPNGMAVSEDGRTLWVVESDPGAIVRFAIGADGSAGAREVVCEMPHAVPDGISVTTDGSLVIPCYRPDVIYRWREDLGLQTLAFDPQGTTLAGPTNAAFTGPGNDVLVTPNIGRWHLTRLRLEGLVGAPLHRPTAAQLGEA